MSRKCSSGGQSELRPQVLDEIDTYILCHHSAVQRI